MTITLEIPDSAGAVLAASGQDPSRALLEAFALEGYRTNRLSEHEIQQLLGFGYFEQVHGFLKEHGVYLHYSMDDAEHDLAEARRYPKLKAASTEHRAE
jgi:hypothetical protein